MSSTVPLRRPIGSFSWNAALLGAAVGIAGPSYVGTLVGNVMLRVLLSRGHSLQEAYAFVFQYSLSLPVVVHLVAEVFFSLACGWVSAAYGRGAPIAQGVLAGLLTVSFTVIMLLSPADGAMPLLFRAISLGVPVLGSIAGAYAFTRKA